MLPIKKSNVLYNYNVQHFFESNIMRNEMSKIFAAMLLATVAISPSGAYAKPANTAKQKAELAQGKAQAYSLREIEFTRTEMGEGRISIDTTHPDALIKVRKKGSALYLDFPGGDIPANLLGKINVGDKETRVSSIDAFTANGKSGVVISMKGAWDYKFRMDGSRAIITVSRSMVEDGEFTGDKVSFDFQDITVRDALNSIADFTGLNVVISDSVTGNITLRLKEVPWDQALEIILQSRGLDSKAIGNVIQIAPKEELDSRIRAYLQSKKDISDLEDVKTESFELSYQRANSVVALLTGDKQRILSKRGSAVADDRTNTVFVQDTPSRLHDVRQLLKKIDVTVRQVQIEARFVEASTNFSHQLGAKMTASGSGVNGSMSTSSTLPGAAGGLGGVALSIFNSAATKTLGIELMASETDGAIRSIAAPRVVTADKAEAIVESGTEIPYQQATQSGATSVMFKKATLSLKVTPQVTPDGKVNMVLKVNQDTVGTIFNGVPSINTKNVVTQVLVENGGTVVVGGVYLDDANDSISKVPGVGDVPLIGNLFRNKTKTKSRKELLVFITPRVLADIVSEDATVRASDLSANKPLINANTGELIAPKN